MRFFVDGSITTPTTEYLTNPKYQQVEYLESTGTQYIDTGVIYNDNTGLDVGFSFTPQTITSAKHLIGGQTNDTRYNPLYCTVVDGSNKIRTLLNIDGSANITMDFDTDYHTLQFNTYPDKNVVYDSVVKGTVESIGTGNSINLFRRNLSSGYAYCNGRLYYVKLYNGSNIVCNFIPAIRKEDGKPGMYDKVSGQFFTNAGTGEFLYGNPVYSSAPKGYKECEYLESTGTQYIDTGVLPVNDMEFECKFTFTSLVSTNLTIIGSRDGEKCCQPIGAYNNKWSASIGGAYDANGTSVSSGTPYTISATITNGQTITTNVNGSQASTCTSTTGLPSQELYIFARNFYGNTDPADSRVNGRLYFLKIKANGVLVRNFIPVLREADNTPGMYDRVSNTFFTNKGTGTFTYKLKERQTEKVTRILYSGSKMRLVRNTAA